MKKIQLLIISIILITSCEDSLNKNRAYISAMSGQVTLNGSIIKSTGQSVRYGSIIETGPGAFCDIIIDEKNIMRITSNTRLVFNIYGNSDELVIEKGWLSAVIRKKFTRDGKFTISTPSSVASVRGTSFCIKVESDTSTYFCVCNGSVVLGGKGDAGTETVSAAAHSARKFTLDKKSGFVTVDRNPGLLYHDNTAIENLAVIINEKVDWTLPDSL